MLEELQRRNFAPTTIANSPRVRRKRQRLGPNGSIESDPAVNVRARGLRPRAGSLPIESYRFSLQTHGVDPFHVDRDHLAAGADADDVAHAALCTPKVRELHRADLRGQVNELGLHSRPRPWISARPSISSSAP
jgi:hypothetical protein